MGERAVSTISASVDFAAGHRILGLEGADEKCRNIHGHSWRATMTFIQDSTWPPCVDFGTIKYTAGAAVRAALDHVFILDKNDDFKKYLETNVLRFYATDGPPTTERIAEEIGRMVMSCLTEQKSDHRHYGVAEDSEPPCPNAKLLSVRLDEGPVNTATWENPTFVQRLARGGAIPGYPQPSLPYIPGITLTGAVGGSGQQ